MQRLPAGHALWLADLVAVAELLVDPIGDADAVAVAGGDPFDDADGEWVSHSEPVAGQHTDAGAVPWVHLLSDADDQRDALADSEWDDVGDAVGEPGALRLYY